MERAEIVTKSSDSNSAKPEKLQDESSKAGFNPTTFLLETKEELNKVVWPDRQRLIGESAAVVLMVALSATIISLVDQLFSWLAKTIF